MSFLTYSKDFHGLVDVFLRDPVRYLPLAQLIDNIMTRDSAMSHSQRELLALYSSRLNHCNYCVDSHTCVLTHMGNDEAVLESLTDISVEAVDDQMQVMLVFARKLTLQPAHISIQDIASVKARGWSDQAIEDAICVVSTFALVNRLVNGIGIAATDDHFQQVGGMVSKQGYAPLVQMVQDKAANYNELQRQPS